MKLKITLIFIIIAAALIFVVFNLDVLSYKSNQTTAPDGETEFTKKIVFDYLNDKKLVTYNEKLFKLDKALIDSADVINIHFWASWCAPCVNEVPELIEFAKRVSIKNDKNLKVLFLTVTLDDTPEDLNKFLKSFPEFNKEPFIRIWDKDKSFSKLVNADRLPMTVILNKNIPEPRIVRGVVEWKNINF